MKRIAIALFLALAAVSAAFAIAPPLQPVLWQSSLVHDGISLNFATNTFYMKAPGQAARYGAFTDLFTFTRNSTASQTMPSGLLGYVNENQASRSNPTVAQLGFSLAVADDSSVVWGVFPTGTAGISFGNNSTTRAAYPNSALAVGGTGSTVTGSVYVQMTDLGAPVLGTSAVTGDFSILINGNYPSTNSNVTQGCTLVTGAIYRCSITSTQAAGAANYGVIKDTGTTARTFVVTGFQFQMGRDLGTFITTSGAKKYDQPRIQYLSQTTGTNWLPQSNNLSSAWTLSGSSVTRTNIALQSQTFDNASWSKFGGSFAANAVASPDGQVTADKFTEDTSTGTHNVSQGVTITSGGTYTMAVYAKAAERSFVFLQFKDQSTGTNGVQAIYNLTTSAISSNINFGTGSGVNAVIYSVGNGWFKCVLTGAINGGVTAAAATIIIPNNSGTASFTGDGASGIYLWGAQIETGLYSSYQILTTSASATAIDNTYRSPIATDTASVLTESAGGTFHLARQDATISAGAVQAYSVYLKANGRGFARVQLTDTTESNGCFVDVNLTTGATSAVSAIGTGASATTSAATAGDGYFKFTVSCSISASATTGRAQVLLANALATVNYSGDGVSGALMWGSQLEGGTAASVYTDTFERNLLLQTQTVDNASWTKNQATITANSTAAPDASVTADTLVETAVTNFHTLVQSPTFVAGRAYTFSVYVKSSTRSVIQLQMPATQFTTGVYQFFNATTCAAGSAAQNVLAVSATSIGSGWCRVSITQIATISGAGGATIALATDANSSSSNNYAGDGTSGIFIWGAQINVGTSPATYVATVASTNLVPQFTNSDATVLGFLSEAARTNIALQSETLGTTWTAFAASQTADAAVAPDGLKTADKLVEDVAASGHAYIQNVTVTANTVNNFSIFIKAAERSSGRLDFRDAATGLIGCKLNFNLLTQAIASAALTTGTCTASSITSYPNGWYRVSLASNMGGAITAGQIIVFLNFPYLTDSYTGDGASGFYVWGAQMEAGQFASSYIQTTTASVTRSADLAVRTVGTEYSAAAGTVVISGTTPPGQDATGQGYWSVDDNSVNNSIRLLRVAAVDIARMNFVVGGTPQATHDFTFTNNAAFKHATAWAAADFASDLNGGTVQSSATGTLPTVTLWNIGAVASGTQANAPLKTFDYLPVRKSNGYLQQASAR